MATGQRSRAVEGCSMTPEITDAMVHDMDETADFMHTVPAPFPTIEHAIGIPPCRPSKLYRTKGLVTPFSRGITVTGQAQGQKDADRRDALRRGGR
jgi:hypothetical protein